MPQHRRKDPSYLRHKGSGQAVVRLCGKDFYLGVHGAPESRDRYYALLARWHNNGQRIEGLSVEDDEVVGLAHAPVEAPRRAPEPPAGPVMAEVALAYVCDREGRLAVRRHAAARLSQIKSAMKPIKALFSRLPAAEFDARSLLAVRDEFVRLGWTRRFVNEQVGLVRDMIRWAGLNRMVPAGRYHELADLKDLRRGDTPAPERRKIKPVAESMVEATLPHLSKQVAAMVRLQLHTAMRPGEVVIMRGCDLDTGEKVWRYTPGYHKTEHHGEDHERVVYLGPEAQGMVREFLKADLSAYLFDPRDAERDRHAKAPTHRRKGQRRNPRKTDRVVRDRYDVDSYRRAVERGCDAADAKARKELTDAGKEVPEGRIVPRWSPHRLRHTAATRIRKLHGAEAAQILCGHRHLSTTEIYAEKNEKLAVRVAAKHG